MISANFRPSVVVIVTFAGAWSIVLPANLGSTSNSILAINCRTTGDWHFRL